MCCCVVGCWRCRCSRAAAAAAGVRVEWCSEQLDELACLLLQGPQVFRAQLDLHIDTGPPAAGRHLPEDLTLDARVAVLQPVHLRRALAEARSQRAASFWSSSLRARVCVKCGIRMRVYVDVTVPEEMVPNWCTQKLNSPPLALVCRLRTGGVRVYRSRDNRYRTRLRCWHILISTKNTRKGNIL